MSHISLSTLLDHVLAPPEDGRPIEDLMVWLKAADPQGGEHCPRTLRLRMLAGALESHPRSADLKARISEVWGHATALRLLAESGLPDRTSFLDEGVRKLVDSFIPRLDAEDDLHALLARLNVEEEDAVWIENLSPEDLAPWQGLLEPLPETWGQAALLLAHRASAVGLSRDILELDRALDAESPFLRLPQVVQAWADAPQDAECQKAWDNLRGTCRATLEVAFEHLDDRGISTDLVYRLDLLDALLVRIDALLHAEAGQEDKQAFAARIVRGTARERSLRAHFRRALKRLSRKVVEHTGETGEHYVVRNRKEWHLIAWSAGGAGIVVAVAGLLKYALAAYPLSPLVEGLATTADYAVCFVGMQLLGLTLASRQPAMTAAALAAGLEREDGLDEEVELVAGITRSQVVATLGNVLVAIPVGLLFCFIAAKISGQALLPLEKAQHGIASLHPYRSGTIFFAILMGVCLWLQSLVAGWAGNWSAYRRLPEAIVASRKTRAVFGVRGAHLLGRLTRRHMSGVAGYLALAFMLGFLPVLAARFVGLHVELRHVSLESAAWAMDAGSLWSTPQFQWEPVLWGLFSIAIIGAFNFSVSFWLALRTAMRARDLDPTGRRELRRRILKALNERPGRFLWAPARMEAAPQGSNHA
jgi:site-specific recombinase